MSYPNKLCLWRDGVLYLGDSFDPQMHRHNAVQCCIALKGVLQVRTRAGATWQSCSLTVIGANVPHSIANPDGPLCILFLEKTSSDYRSILDFHGVRADHETLGAPLLSSAPVSGALKRALREAMSAELDEAAANELRAACLHFLRGRMPEPKALDPRISTLLSKLHDEPDQVFVGADLARLIGLSQSRMQHVFKEQLGLPIRRYVLWMRLRHALELALSGTSLTTAAHASGFSDLAHFTRTFRATFGIKPSELLTGGTGLVPLLCERA